VSVRSGAKFSMPGMMDTILNLGLNDQAVEGLARVSGDRRFALDSYRRFVQMYAGVVLDVPKHDFETMIAAAKKARRVADDTGLTEKDLEKLVAAFKKHVKKATGHGVPAGPRRPALGSGSRPCSGAGTTSARGSTGGSTGSPTTSAPP
jgi:pyruvate,orthophosphate dikinase